jgi:predicted RNase H-like nuclease (RuvC/YqgF family)
VDNLRSKLENNYLEELEALKRAHINALEEAERENVRLREAFQDKSRESEQQVNKFNKQRQMLEDNLNYLKMDNEHLRQKIIETEQMGQYELSNLKERLTAMHENEIGDLITKQQGHIKSLEEELSRLENIIHAKNTEIEQLIKDKVTNRSLFDA